MHLKGIKHDPETGDYLYIGTSSNPRGHFLSRLDYTGNLKWGRVYNYSTSSYTDNNTFEYSPTYQTFYFTFTSGSKRLFKVNSLNGDILNSFEIPEAYYSEKLSLSRDELALYGSIQKSSNELVLFRFDTATSRINTKII